MPFQQAEAIFGKALRPLAGSRQVWSNWKNEGLPWEVAGPLLLRSAQPLPASETSDSSVIRRGDMTQEAWGALLKVRKVLSPGGAPTSVQRVLKAAIDEAARQLDETRAEEGKEATA